MAKYICDVCGYEYIETSSQPWSKLSADWKCPVCGVSKDQFTKA